MTTPAHRNRRRTLFAIVVILAAISVAIFWLGSSSGIVKKAQSLSIGSTPAEVETVLGPPDLKASGASGTHYLYGRVFMVRRGMLNTVGKWVGWTVATQFDDWPVYLHFNQEGRLTRIKAGDELIW